MAKALMGYMHSDLQTAPRLSAENRRLRARVAELEELVTRLQIENDRLTTTVSVPTDDDALRDLEVDPVSTMQPV